MNTEYRKKHKFTIFTVVFFIAIILASCAPTKRAAYFRTNNDVENINQPDQVYEIMPDSLYTIKPGDELYVTVTTSDNEANNFGMNQVGFTDIDILSYMVDRNGFLKLPYISKVRIEGLTISEASKLLESELSQYLYQPVVSMKLVNVKITILGEVQAPGVYRINNKSVNIFQALGYAGDITTYGDREKVLIVREENNAVIKKYVDLTNDNILGSSWYNLHPNDIIYIEPMQRKIFGIETVPWALITSVISTTVVILTFMITITS